MTDFSQFAETRSTDAFALQNERLLKVRLSGGSIQAKRGSMVAYQGDVQFKAAKLGGVSKFIKKAVTGEGQSLMEMSGSGEVFLADQAQEVHLLELRGERMTVNGPNLLAFDADISWDIERVQGGGGMMGAGLFNTTLQGSGEALQMAFGGSGWVLVQPSEGRISAAQPQGGSSGGLGGLLGGN